MRLFLILTLIHVCPIHAMAPCKKHLAHFTRREFLGISLTSYLTLLGSKAAPAAASSGTAIKQTNSVGEFQIIKQTLIRGDEVTVWSKGDPFLKRPPKQSNPPEPANRDRQVVLPRAHLSWNSMNFMKRSLERKDFDWLALEVIPASLQKDVDPYLKADRSTADFRNAEKTLLHLFALEGESRKVEGPEHPLLAALDLAREQSIPVYAVGLPAASSVAFHRLVPQKGRGLIATDQSYAEASPARFQSLEGIPTLLLMEESP